MNIEMLKENLAKAYNFLNQLEVKGAENINNMYKALYHLEVVIQEIIKEEEENKKPKEGG